MLTPEWQLAHEKVRLAYQREQITPAQAIACRMANTSIEAMRRLHGFQRANAAQWTELNQKTPNQSHFIPNPNPKPMKFADLKFPAGAVFATAIITPLVDHFLTGGYSPATYIIESICAAAVVGLVVVGFVNTVNDK